MKLPFKLPAFKLSKFKLPTFGKNKAEEDDELEDDDFEYDESEQEAVAPPPPVKEGGDGAAPATDPSEEGTAPSGDDTASAKEGEASAGEGDQAAVSEGDEEVPSALEAMEDSVVGGSEDDDDLDDDKDQEQASKKRKLMMIGGGVGGALLLVGLGLFVFSGSGHDEDQADGSGVPKFEMALPPKGRAAVEGSLNAIVEGAKGPGAGIVVAASTVMAFADIAPPQVTDGPLPDIKDPALIEQSQQGPLPKIAEDGRLPWQVYAKSFDAKDSRPKIALIMTGLGLSQAATEAAIALLPGPVTLAFDPYAPDLQAWAEKARQAGHETLIVVPLEPSTFPVDDPGPQGLMTINAPEENLLRLEYVLSRMSQYVGVISAMGSKFNQNEDFLKIFLGSLKNRGLLFVDGSADTKSLAPALAQDLGLNKAFADLVLDTTPTGQALDARLGELENLAKTNAYAVAIIDPYPVSIRQVAAWAAGLEEKKLVLVPVSVVADKQFLK